MRGLARVLALVIPLLPLSLSFSVVPGAVSQRGRCSLSRVQGVSRGSPNNGLHLRSPTSSRIQSRAAAFISSAPSLRKSSFMTRRSISGQRNSGRKYAPLALQMQQFAFADDDDEFPMGHDDDSLEFLDSSEDVGASKDFWLEYASAKLKASGFSANQDSKSSDIDLGNGPLGPEVAKDVIREAKESLRQLYDEIDERTQRHLSHILAAFRKGRVGAHYFQPTDGYGHGDIGRDTLDEIYAELFGAERALVRVQMFSGTHAITCALFAALRPGDEMLAISGPPYDTLEEVIGIRKEDPDLIEGGLTGSLHDYGVTYKQVELLEGGGFDFEAIGKAITPKTKLIHIQRSCGYQWRPSIPVAVIGQAIEWIKKRHPDICVFVDNCYGEFVEDQEPTHVGADLIAGSLIKNPGGTLVPSGGYVAGKAKYVKAAFNRLSAPGVDGGATLGKTRNLYQGLWNAPNVVGEALKGTALVGAVMNRLGFETNPPFGELRTDIICAAKLMNRENLISFCRSVQRNSPIGSFIVPEPGMTVGYGDEVIFADGTFIDGSTLELSADGPLREPFVAYCQGGTHWTHWALVLEEALPNMTANKKAAEMEHV